ncbi:MAG: sulfatase-like hydrolase/transferase [bacterium]|nr:sulfatase-like hydrolase/transferase [bacterium]
MKLKNSNALNIFLLCLLGLSLVEGVIISVCRPTFNGLQGTYRGNKTWSGKALGTGLDSKFSTKTLKQIKKDFPKNVFSVEWEGHIFIPETDTYLFSTNSDDGSQLLIDENLVVKNGGEHGLQEKQGKIHLRKGMHSISIRYMQSGGLAALRVFWAPDPFPRAPIETARLFPKGSSLVGFWLYRQAQNAFPFLLTTWLIALFWLSLSSRHALRVRQKIDLFRHVQASSPPESVFSHSVQRLFVQPVLFAAGHIRQPQVCYWSIVALYSLIIFLTLSYARSFSTFMLARYGDDIFSRITVYTLLASGAALFLYVLRLKGHRVSRLLSFSLIVLIYIFFLSPGFRVNIFAFLNWLGLETTGLQELDIYPIYAGEKVHFLEYGFLALLLCKAFSYRVKDKSAYLLSLLLVYLIGMTDEGIQWALPQRVGEYRDIWMNFTSGALALLAVLLVIRPRAFQRDFRWASLRPVCYTLAAATVYTGLFLQVVHGFASPIFHPDSGTQFVSLFPEEQLLQFDKYLLQRYEGQPLEDVPRAKLKAFSDEAERHQYLRDFYHRNNIFFNSHCEQEILKTYYRSYLRKKNLTLHEYGAEQLKIAPKAEDTIFYTSQAQELGITGYEQRNLWLFVTLSTSLLCLLVSFWPLTPDRRSRMSQHLPEAHFERLFLRPVFLLVFIAGIIVMLRPEPAARRRQYTNLLLVTVDSTQPDYWSAYGYTKNTTPFFDTLVPQGVLFSNAIVPSSWTIPSLVSLLTGLNPNVHGIDIRGKLMDERIPTLFEALEAQGYTIGDTSYILTEPSVNSVFKKVDISPDAALGEGRSEESYLLSWMENHRDRPFFAWVHFHTTHLPYKATPPYNQLFLEEVDPEVFQDKQIQFVTSNIIVRKGEVEFDKERHSKVLRALYAQALRQQDAKIGKVLMKLDELGLRDDTLIVVTADHGEELLEHGFIGHASTSWDGTVYDDLIRVPLLLSHPRSLPQGKKIDAQVGHIDLMPTALDILEIPLAAPIQGKSYLPLILGTGDFQENVFSETTPCGYSCPSRLDKNRLRAVRTNEWKLISHYDRESDNTEYELYALRDDPAESANVLGQHPDVAEEFQQKMQRWMDAPQQFQYEHKKSEEKHYLDLDVEVRPIVLSPKVGAVLTPDSYEKRILVEWIGDEKAEYLIEYDVGSGGYHMSGELEVVGTKQWYGPFPEDIWQALPLYNPWKFRIIPKAHPKYPSDWISFEMKYE